MEIIDYIVVGSGCTGAMAAETLCVSGKRVLMIDVGLEGDTGGKIDTDFVSKRANDNQQSDFFLGSKFEALGEVTHPNIPQQTPQRQFMSDLTDKIIPVLSDNFFPVESLALGGLGNGWGLGSYAFSDNELQKVGLPIAPMKDAYQVVAQRVGVSGEEHDDTATYCHDNAISLQPSIQMNASAQSVYEQYLRKKVYFHEKGLYMGRPSLALLTEDKDNRKAYNYNDLDFYGNAGDSAYRPYITINKLVEEKKLDYQKGWLAVSFREEESYTVLECIDIQTKEKKSFYTYKLILATGTLGTARIVMRSFKTDKQLPVLCNAYTYMAIVHWPFLGKRNTDKFCGLAQLAMFYDKDHKHSEVAMASVYNYRSLLNFRILKQMPLNHSDGMKFLRLLIPALVIAGIFHPADYQSQNYVRLRKDNSLTGDCLETNYSYLGDEMNEIVHTEKAYSKAFARLSCLVLKKVRTTTGASIHYAGTLPFSETEKLFSLSPGGKLYGTKRVFVADGSGFSFLPGKGLTLSLMANAHLVAKNVLEYG